MTGQDATTRACSSVLLGDQCMTVYKAIKKEADAAAALAIALIKGKAAVPTHRHGQGHAGATATSRPSC